ncbi:hypothetical protein Tco_0847836, partial [Tanacetum coccineum]
RNGFNKALELDQSKVGGKLINVEEARPRDDNSGPRRTPEEHRYVVMCTEFWYPLQLAREGKSSEIEDQKLGLCERRGRADACWVFLSSSYGKAYGL